VKFTNAVQFFFVFIFNIFNLNMSLTFEITQALPSVLCKSINHPSCSAEIHDVGLNSETKDYQSNLSVVYIILIVP
jgi:hypothetical protein